MTISYDNGFPRSGQGIEGISDLCFMMYRVSAGRVTGCGLERLELPGHQSSCSSHVISLAFLPVGLGLQDCVSVCMCVRERG